MARWAKMSSFTRKSQQIFVTTVLTPDTGKAIAQDAAIKVAIDDLF